MRTLVNNVIAFIIGGLKETCCRVYGQSVKQLHPVQRHKVTSSVAVTNHALWSHQLVPAMHIVGNVILTDEHRLF